MGALLTKKQLPKHKRWCLICWKRGHATETCWYNDQWRNQQHQTAWNTPSTMQQQPARASEKEFEHRPYNYSLTLGDQPMGSLQQPAQASTQQLAYKSPEQSIRHSLGQQSQHNLGTPYKNSLGEHKSNQSNWAILIDAGAEICVAPSSFAPNIPLTALERAVELRTATGEAIPIFGQKNMHLVTQNLCFEVSFVIANVTTPILGVDTLLRENLSLRFQGTQQQLFHQSGEFTQLYQEGQLLYLRAFPVQLGFTIHMIGNLLAESILPANKLEQAALGVRAELSNREVLDKGGALGHSFSQKDLDNKHNLGKNKTALGTTALQQLGQQAAYKERRTNLLQRNLLTSSLAWEERSRKVNNLQPASLGPTCGILGASTR